MSKNHEYGHRGTNKTKRRNNRLVERHRPKSRSGREKLGFNFEPLESRILLAAVSVFDNNEYVDSLDGTPLDSTADAESHNIQTSLTALGHNVMSFTGISAGEFSQATSGRNVLVIPELENGDLDNDLSAAARTTIRDFVDGGGGLIVLGGTNTEAALNLPDRPEDLLNNIFGFNLDIVVTGGVSTIQPGAAGTAFDGGPAVLSNHVANHSILSGLAAAGGSSIYELATGETTVAEIPFGEGSIVYLGWSWFDSDPPDVGAQNGDWMAVLDSAVATGVTADQFEDNGTQDTATDLMTVVHTQVPDVPKTFPPGPVPGTGEPPWVTLAPEGDHDWYKVTSWATGSMDFTIETINGHLVGEVVDGGGNVIASDSMWTGPLYVLDNTGRVLLFDPDSQTLTVAAGEDEITALTGETSADFESSGAAFATDLSGNLYFAEGNSDSILKLAPDSVLSILTSEADILAVTGALGGATADLDGLTFAADGSLYVVEDETDSLLRIDPFTGSPSIFVSAATLEGLAGITSVDLDDVVAGPGVLYLSSSNGTPSEVIFTVDLSTGTPTVLAKSDNAAGFGGEFVDLEYMAIDQATGDVIVADEGVDTIWRVDDVTGVVSTFISEATLDSLSGNDTDPDSGIEFDAFGNFFLANNEGDQILVFTAASSYTTGFVTDLDDLSPDNVSIDETGIAFGARTTTLSVPVIKGEMLWLHVFDDSDKEGERAVYTLDIVSNDIFDALATPYPDSVLVVDSASDPGGVVLRLDQGGDVIQVIDDPIFSTGFISDVEIGPDGDIFVILDVDTNGTTYSLVRFSANGVFEEEIVLTPDLGGTNYLVFGFDVAPDGTFWVGRPNAGEIAHVDSSGNDIETFLVGDAPNEAEFNPHTGLVYFTGGGGPIGLRALDPLTGTVIQVTPSTHEFDLASINDEGKIWLTNQTNMAAELYSAAGNLLTSIPLGGALSPRDVEQDRHGNVWVTRNLAGDVQKYVETSPGTFELSVTSPHPVSPEGLATVGAGDNETQETASDLGMVVHAVLEELTLPWGDEDWFKITTWADQGKLDIWMDLVDSNMNGILDPEEILTLELVNAAGDLIAVGRTDFDDFSVHVEGIPAEKNEMFFIRVVGDPSIMSQNEYSLDIVNDDRFDFPRRGLYVVDQVTSPVSGPLDNIYEINPDTGGVLRTLTVPDPSITHTGLAYDGDALYYVDSDGPGCFIDSGLHDCIYTVDPLDGSIVNIWGAPIDSGLDALAADGEGGFLYGADFATDTIYQIDIGPGAVLGTGAVFKSFIAPDSVDIDGGLGFNAENGNLYASLAGGDIAVINPMLETLVTTLLTPLTVSSPLGIGLLGGRLFAANNSTAMIYELGAATGTIVNSFASPGDAPTAADGGPEDLNGTRNDTRLTMTDLGMFVHIKEEELTVPWGDEDWFKVTTWADDGSVDLRITLVDHNMNGQIDPEELLGVELYSDGVPGDLSDDDNTFENLAATGKLQGFDLVIAHVPAEKHEMFKVRVFGQKTEGLFNDTILVGVRDVVSGSSTPGFDPGGEVHRFDQAGNRIQVIDHAIFDQGVVSDVEVGPAGTPIEDHIFVALDLFYDGPGGAGQLVHFNELGTIQGVIAVPNDAVGLVAPAFFHSFGFDIAPDGTFWVALQNSDQVAHLDSMGKELARFDVGEIPVDVAYNPDDDFVYIGYHTTAVGGAARVDQLNPSLSVLSPVIGAPQTDGAFGINFTLFDATPNDFWVSDHRGFPAGPGAQIEHRDTAGNLINQFAPFTRPIDPEADQTGNVWTTAWSTENFPVSTLMPRSVEKFDASGASQFVVEYKSIPEVIFSDDLESGIVGWTIDNTGVDGIPGTADDGQWHLTTLRAGDGGHTGANSFYYGVDATQTYSNDTSGVLTSPVIDLSGLPVGVADIDLSFNYFLEHETTMDMAVVDVVNGGTTFLADEFSGLTNPSGTFLPFTADLSQFAGEQIQLQFSFKANVDGVAEGWYVDDLLVTASAFTGYPIGLAVATHTIMGFNEYTMSISNNDRFEHNDFFPGYPTTSSLMTDPPLLNNVDAGSPSGGNFPVNVSTDFNHDQSEMDIAVNPTNPHHLAIASHSFNNLAPNFFFDVFQSLDGGHTWMRTRMGDAAAGAEDGFPFDSEGDPDVVNRFDPQIEFDKFGNLYVLYGVGSGATESAIVVQRSIDGGVSWDATTVFSEPYTDLIGERPFQDRFTLNVGPHFNGTQSPTDEAVWVSWTRFNDGTPNEILASGARATESGSPVPGLIFSGFDAVSDGPGNYQHSAVAVGPHGAVYVTWVDFDSGIMMFDTDPDGLNAAPFGVDSAVTAVGLGFSTLISAQPERGISPIPFMEVDRSGGPNHGRTYIVYTDLGTGIPDTDVLITYTDDPNNPLGQTFSLPVPVHSPSLLTQFHGNLDVDPTNGDVVATYYDARFDEIGEADRIVAMSVRSTDGGLTFGNEFVLSNDFSDQSDGIDPPQDFLEYIGVSAFDGAAFFAWADNSTNTPDLDVFFNAIHPPTDLGTLSMATWEDELTLPWFDEDWYVFDIGKLPWPDQDQLKIVLDLEDTDGNGVLDPHEQLTLELYRDPDGVDDLADPWDFQRLVPTDFFYLGDEPEEELTDDGQFRLKAFFNTDGFPINGGFPPALWSPTNDVIVNNFDTGPGIFGDALDGRFYLRVFGGPATVLPSIRKTMEYSSETFVYSSSEEMEMASNEYDLHIIPTFSFSEDNYEFNDNLEHAYNLGSLPKIILPDATIHSDEPSVTNDDYFKITAQDTGKLVINAFFVDDAKIGMGNLDMEIIKLDETGMPMVIHSATSTDDNEQLVIPVVTQEMYFIHIFGVEDPMTGHKFPNAYELEIENFQVPPPVSVFLDPNDLTAQNNGTFTQDATPKLFIQSDLKDFEQMGIMLDGIPDFEPGAPSKLGGGADIKVILNGINTGTEIKGNATRMGDTSLWMFTVPNSQPLLSDTYVVNANVAIEDGKGAIGHSLSTTPLLLTVDAPSLATIEGRKWNDINGNRIRDAISQEPDIIFVVDNSGSAGAPFVGTEPVGDINGDGTPNSILDAELLAFIELNNELIARTNLPNSDPDHLDPNTEVSIVTFFNAAMRLDMDPVTAGDQVSTLPSTDVGGNLISDVEDILRSIVLDTATSVTNFEAPLQAAEMIFSDLGTAANEGVVVFLSDGGHGAGTDFTDEVDRLRNNVQASLFAFGIGSGAVLADLQLIDPGAEIILDPGDLVEKVSNLPSSFVEPFVPGVTIYVDADNSGDLNAGDISTVTMVDNPLTPADETGLYSLGGLQPGSHVVREVEPADSMQTFPESGFHTVSLSQGELDDEGNDFGNQFMMMSAGYEHIILGIQLFENDGGTPGAAITGTSVTVGQDFFVGITAVDDRIPAAGLVALAIDLGWDPSVLEEIDNPFNPGDPTSLLVTPAFPIARGGSLDNSTGFIDELGAASLPSTGTGMAIGMGTADVFSFLSFRAEQTVSDMSFNLTVGTNGFSVADNAMLDVIVEPFALDVVPDSTLTVTDTSGDPDDRNVQFTTPLSQLRPGTNDSLLVRPALPDNRQSVTVTNSGSVAITLSEIQVNATDVSITPELTSAAGDDITLAPGAMQEFTLEYAPTLPSLADPTTQTFNLANGLVILSNAAGSPSIDVTLAGASTFNSDIDYDGSVGNGDVGVFLANLGEMSGDLDFDPSTDVNGDGIVNFGDVASIDIEFGRTRPAPALAALSRSTAMPISAGTSAQEDVFRGRYADQPGMLEPISQASNVVSLSAEQIVETRVAEITVAAVNLWDASWSGRDAAAQLVDVEYRVRDLGGSVLARATDPFVEIDDDAAGWFLDKTPIESNEFDSNLVALGDDARDRIDLLTVILHELGHLPRREDLLSDADPDHIMSNRLTAGVRRLSNRQSLDEFFASLDDLNGFGEGES